MNTLEQLKLQARWVCYRADKAPINPRTITLASTSNSDTWATYAEAVAACTEHNLAGVGIVFNGDGLVGIDLDDCLEYDAELKEWKRPAFIRYIMNLCDSYTEVSPSKTGLHILGFGSIDRALKTVIENFKVEVYATGRYFTYTDDVVIKEVNELVNIQFGLNELFELANDQQKKLIETVVSSSATRVPDAWAQAVFNKSYNSALTMISQASEGMKHNTRLKASKLLGGAIAMMQEHGYTTMSVEDAVERLYEANIPDKNNRKEYKAIYDGILYGMSMPLKMPVPQATRISNFMASSIEDIAAEETEVEYPYTDLGNGMRFAAMFKSKLCYCSELGTWLLWNDKYWQRVEGVVVRKLAHNCVYHMYFSAVSNSAVIDSELSKWALKSQNTSRIDAMITSAQPYLLKQASLFDNHINFINARNGIVNLLSGELLPHSAEFYFTKMLDVDYIPNARSEFWDNFIKTIFDNDIELMQYVQRAVGYSLTGRIDEHCLFFCYGTGRNGKSSFIKALELLLGEYCITAPIEALLESNSSGENATPQLARLMGRRIVITQEMPENKRINESLVKTITGGDRIIARELYKSAYEFIPTHKLWITGNHKPRVTGTDEGIWRRLRIVPFIIKIKDTQQISFNELIHLITVNLSAILTWAVEGSIVWNLNGLGSCSAVESATSDYRQEEDAVARFIADRCILHPAASIHKQALYLAWKEWAEDEGDRSMLSKSQRWLIRQLTSRFNCTAGGSGRTLVVGIKINEVDGM